MMEELLSTGTYFFIGICSTLTRISRKKLMHIVSHLRLLLTINLFSVAMLLKPTVLCAQGSSVDALIDLHASTLSQIQPFACQSSVANFYDGGELERQELWIHTDQEDYYRGQFRGANRQGPSSLGETRVLLDRLDGQYYIMNTKGRFEEWWSLPVTESEITGARGPIPSRIAEFNSPIQFLMWFSFGDGTRTLAEHRDRGAVPRSVDPVNYQETEVPGLVFSMDNDPKEFIDLLIYLDPKHNYLACRCDQVHFADSSRTKETFRTRREVIEFSKIADNLSFPKTVESSWVVPGKETQLRQRFEVTKLVLGDNALNELPASIYPKGTFVQVLKEPADLFKGNEKEFVDVEVMGDNGNVERTLRGGTDDFLTFIQENPGHAPTRSAIEELASPMLQATPSTSGRPSRVPPPIVIAFGILVIVSFAMTAFYFLKRLGKIR
jgi:hypothetical protein